MPRVLVIADRDLPWERTRELRDLSQSFGPKFDLEGKVKSVVTVVAKVAHYWQMHAIVYGLDDGGGSR